MSPHVTDRQNLHLGVVRFSEEKEELVLRCHGADRPGIIAAITGQLEAGRLYVESIVFNLLLPATNECEMHLVAKGSVEDLRSAAFLVDNAAFLPAPDRAHAPASPIHWPDAQMFHVGLMTPDRPGLVAHIAGIVGERREVASSAAHRVTAVGSFVHLIGLTHNSEGPHGGTAYFSLRALVATHTAEAQQAIMRHLGEWAATSGLDDDLWVVSLNRAAHGVAAAAYR